MLLSFCSSLAPKRSNIYQHQYLISSCAVGAHALKYNPPRVPDFSKTKQKSIKSFDAPWLLDKKMHHHATTEVVAKWMITTELKKETER